MAYLTLKLIHLVLAITALGANLTYGAWFARANMHPPFAPVALRGIKFLDDWIANPAYLLMLPTGAAMVVIGGLSFRLFEPPPFICRKIATPVRRAAPTYC